MDQLSKHFDLTGQNILVTGASGDIGSAIAVLLAGMGANVGIHYRSNRIQAEQTREEIERLGARAVLLPADLQHPQDCRALIEEFRREFGGIDVLVNNAGGIVGARPILDIDENDWDGTISINAKMPFFMAQAAMQSMIAAGNGGKIINISSISAKYGGGADSIHYGAAKAALEAISRGMARLGAEHGILVNTVQAGFIDTGLHRKMGRSEAQIARRIEKIPLKRAGQPMEVAYMVAFLVSEMAGFICGEIFTVAGGD